MATKSKASSEKKALKDPKGGLTAAGRAHFKKTEGANLKPGVKGPADTPEKQKRKGSFLRRHFANQDAGPLKDDKGEPTRHALSAAAWGEPVPETKADVKKLAEKGNDLLKKYHDSDETAAKGKQTKSPKKSPGESGKSATAKSTSTVARAKAATKTTSASKSAKSKTK